MILLLPSNSLQEGRRIMNLDLWRDTPRLQKQQSKDRTFGNWNARRPKMRGAPSIGQSLLCAKEQRKLSRAVHPKRRRWAATLIQQFTIVLALASTPSWADDIKRLFTEIDDPHRLGRIIEHNAADVARSASLSRRYRVVEVDTDLLKGDEPVYLNLFDDVSLLVETLEWSIGVNESTRVWRGRILDFGQSRQHVEMVRQELAEQELPPGLPANLLEQTYLEVTAFLVTYDIDADSGIANPSGQRHFGRVSPDGRGDAMAAKDSPWRLVHEAFRTLSISRISVPRTGELVNYAVRPLQ